MPWINHSPPVYWSTCWKSTFKQQLGCRFDIMDGKSFLYFDICNFICLDTSHDFLALFFASQIMFFIFMKYSCTYIFHRRSLYAFQQNVSHRGRDKIATMLYVTFSKAFSRIKMTLFQFSLNLVQIMAWCRSNERLIFIWLQFVVLWNINKAVYDNVPIICVTKFSVHLQTTLKQD